MQRYRVSCSLLRRASPPKICRPSCGGGSRRRRDRPVEHVARTRRRLRPSWMLIGPMQVPGHVTRYRARVYRRRSVSFFLFILLLLLLFFFTLFSRPTSSPARDRRAQPRSGAFSMPIGAATAVHCDDGHARVRNAYTRGLRDPQPETNVLRHVRSVRCCCRRCCCYCSCCTYCIRIHHRRVLLVHVQSTRLHLALSISYYILSQGV